ISSAGPPSDRALPLDSLRFRSSLGRLAPRLSRTHRKSRQMTILLDVRVPRTLDIIVRDWSSEASRGARLEAWVIEDEQARRHAEQDLAKAGVTARIRSAYKPLVHAFLED